jgi:hypothetical protein
LLAGKVYGSHTLRNRKWVGYNKYNITALYIFHFLDSTSLPQGRRIFGLNAK